MRNDIDEADYRGRMRAVILYMIAGLLVLYSYSNFGHRPSDNSLMTAIWVGTMLHFLPGTPIIRRRSVVRLMNDETTLEHRRIAMSIGFWTAVTTGCIMSIVVGRTLVLPFDVVLIVINAALCAACVSFATLELRAGR